jgi:hypothetical protein
MAELGWTVTEVTQEHLQNLVTQGYMTTMELATCRVPKDPVTLVQDGGYIMTCTAFYEWGFGVPPDQFLCSLPQLYGLELHHMTPSGILHMAAFVTLCEAYIGIEPHFNPWNYFFRTRLQLGSGLETAALGNVDIFGRSGPGVDPYFQLPRSDPPIGWWKVWFFLWNDADVSLFVFMGSCLVPQPK